MKILTQLFRRRPALPELPRYPNRGQASGWMRSKVERALKDPKEKASRLFDPTSGDYLPVNVHVGYWFDDAALKAYRQLKSEYPELVEASLSEPTSFSVSRIADPIDLQAHAHRIHV